jgi:uncharacterized membrane protein YfcA
MSQQPASSPVDSLGDLAPTLLAGAVAVTLLAGFVKGAVGFAMPMIMISGLGSFLAPELALAGLILPTLVTNLSQAFRDGRLAAWQVVRRFWRLIGLVVLGILLAGQLVTALPQAAYLLILGVPIVIFGVTQLAGMPLRFAPRHARRAEIATGVVSGVFGGLSGVWGPPLIAFLLTLGIDKRSFVRVQGVVYGIGSVALLAAHLRSGILNEATLPFSALMVVPAVLGMVLGGRLQNRLDPDRFRRLTLAILTLAGLNLIRRALWG